MNPEYRPPLDFDLPARATSWLLRTRRLEFTRRPAIMGVVNVTPDSFSDGGRFYSTQAAIEHALRLAAQGADILDVGGESTRPYAEPVSADEELRRVIPVVEALSKQTEAIVSIDTSKAVVARAAVAAGAEIINDVTALAGDPEMPAAALETAAGVCAMHMQGTPQTMQDAPAYADVVAEVLAYLAARQRALVAAGIATQRIALDPGIGFGKTHQHNLTLLANCYRFHELGAPLVLGPSRKGFIAKVLCDKQADRTAGVIGVALALASQGVQVLRVHDVEPVRQALLLFEAVGKMRED
ncbi:MAG TPA: dihydropteroate synthase [Pirellulales bacterium]|nr:dihydropteroate synthase [Pirellulales bacterium]